MSGQYEINYIATLCGFCYYKSKMKKVQTGQWPVNWQLAFPPWTAIMKIYLLIVVCISFLLFLKVLTCNGGAGQGKEGMRVKWASHSN